MEAYFLSVHLYGRVLVYALKLEDNILVLPVGRDGKHLFIGIDAAGKIAVSAVAGVL